MATVEGKKIPEWKIEDNGTAIKRLFIKSLTTNRVSPVYFVNKTYVFLCTLCGLKTYVLRK